MTLNDTRVLSFPPNEDFTSRQGKHILDYLRSVGAKTCVIEQRYIDKDYLGDYQLFYSRSFEESGRFTKRYHFFTDTFAHADLETWLKNGETKRLEKSYAGFVIVKPVRGREGHPLIGRTVLPLPTNKNCIFVSNENEVSLFGVRLTVRGLPFQVQDQAVSTCATIALWTVTHPLVDLFQISTYSPAEITLGSASFLSEGRVFPSAGLNRRQMITFLRSLDLDVEVIPASSKELALAAVAAYVNAGIPLIASLRLEREGRKDYHAAVICGYGRDLEGKIDRLFVHDDQISPYTVVTYPSEESGTEEWQTPWNRDNYKVHLETLLVPVYHKIRLDFHGAYKTYLKVIKDEKLNIQSRTELFLTTVQTYKHYLLNETGIKNKETVLTTLFPRFLWIIRIFGKGGPSVDVLLDGTSPIPTTLQLVEYGHEAGEPVRRPVANMEHVKIAS